MSIVEQVDLNLHHTAAIDVHVTASGGVLVAIGGDHASETVRLWGTDQAFRRLAETITAELEKPRPIFAGGAS